jgi:type 1 fimbria pilin
MKKVIVCIAAVAIASVVGFTSFAAPKVGTFTGEIMDSQCALQGGKHDNMIRVGQDEKACTDVCVKIGGTFVMYDAATKITYKLDQKRAAQFSGAKITVTGDLNEATKMITKITAIAKVPS